ncbi:MAG: hypothetical protein EZS28_025662 [Streblomastix strix]|uniref:Uncharacterized protein n=1 Tax=Streblomastix strix TaxID=222440 RepID=A0A5J4V8N9_9EUKA|nr:MAG: hypothetical protein EZS28_025662 [Streblomastix strix]
MEDIMRRDNQITQYLDELSIRMYVEQMRCEDRIEENKEGYANVQQMYIDAARIIDITVKLEGIKQCNEMQEKLYQVLIPSRWSHPLESLSILCGRMKWGNFRLIEGLKKKIFERDSATKISKKQKS